MPRARRVESERKSLLEVAQTISLLSTISEREQDQNVVTLSTLHASKGLEWPHVMLVGVTEGLLPFKLDDDGGRQEKVSDEHAERLQEERRLMYVGITRAQRSLAVSWTKRRKKGREMVAAQPSRFIAEMALDKTTAKEDPREKLKALRAEFASARPRTTRPRRGGRTRHHEAPCWRLLMAACVACAGAAAPVAAATAQADAPPAAASSRRRRSTAAGRRASTACPASPRVQLASIPNTPACAAPSRARGGKPLGGAAGRRHRRRGPARHRRIAATAAAISAVWSGEMQPGSCGKEFKGTWRNAADDSTHPFVLNKSRQMAMKHTRSIHPSRRAAAARRRRGARAGPARQAAEPAGRLRS